ncbi:MAG: hypothetical protein HQL15_09930 [Candidatus Omnitrophica bacterium]|nr:hypothetical protein [Candidatus Omnitrophota bacterium]
MAKTSLIFLNNDKKRSSPDARLVGVFHPDVRNTRLVFQNSKDFYAPNTDKESAEKDRKSFLESISKEPDKPVVLLIFGHGELDGTVTIYGYEEKDAVQFNIGDAADAILKRAQDNVVDLSKVGILGGVCYGANHVKDLEDLIRKRAPKELTIKGKIIGVATSSLYSKGVFSGLGIDVVIENLQRKAHLVGKEEVPIYIKMDVNVYRTVNVRKLELGKITMEDFIDASDETDKIYPTFILPDPADTLEGRTIVNLQEARSFKSKGFAYWEGGNTQLSSDQAMLEKGGIDFTSNKTFQVKNDGNGEIKFHLDSAQLVQLQNAPGFIPVIISVQPMTDLKAFLGILQKYGNSPRVG